MVEGAEVTERDEEYAVGRAFDVALLISASNLTAKKIQAASAALSRLPPSRGYLQLFTRVGAQANDADARRAWKDLAEQAKSIAIAGALVVPGEGFAAAGLRAGISGIMLLARGRAPTRVVSNLDEASHHLVRLGAVAPGTSASMLTTAMRRLSEDAALE